MKMVSLITGIVLMNLSYSVFASQKPTVKSGKIRGKSVKFVQQCSPGVQVTMGEIISDGDVQVLQDVRDTYGLNLAITDGVINGTFWGHPIENKQYGLQTTGSTIVFKGVTYPYDGRSECRITNNQLSLLPIQQDAGNSPAKMRISPLIKYVAIGASVLIL